MSIDESTKPRFTPEPRRSSRRQVYLSPLRYPGSKRQMVPLVLDIISSMPEPVDLFVEPFAGGASVSLQLAGWKHVGSVVLADKDPLIHAFWRVATEDAVWLIDQVNEIEVSLAMWEKMRSSDSTDLRDMALKCLFLNRTSFSGILHQNAGPLGGQSQVTRTIDCRFPWPHDNCPNLDTRGSSRVQSYDSGLRRCSPTPEPRGYGDGPSHSDGNVDYSTGGTNSN